MKTSQNAAGRAKVKRIPILEGPWVVDPETGKFPIIALTEWVTREELEKLYTP